MSPCITAGLVKAAVITLLTATTVAIGLVAAGTSQECTPHHPVET